MLAKGVGKHRAVKYTNHLIVVSRIASEIAAKPLKEFDRKGMEKVVTRINTAKYTEHTKHDYKIIIKKYFQWLMGCDEDEHEYPEQVKWIKTTFKKKRLVPEALLTPNELRALFEAAENPRDRAFIMMDYDGGFRIGEALSLKIMNLTFDKYGAVARVDGKTGPRRVRLTISSTALANERALCVYHACFHTYLLNLLDIDDHVPSSTSSIIEFRKITKTIMLAATNKPARIPFILNPILH